jgi:hypothetical protein
VEGRVGLPSKTNSKGWPCTGGVMNEGRIPDKDLATMRKAVDCGCHTETTKHLFCWRHADALLSAYTTLQIMQSKIAADWTVDGLSLVEAACDAVKRQQELQRDFDATVQLALKDTLTLKQCIAELEQDLTKERVWRQRLELDVDRFAVEVVNARQQTDGGGAETKNETKT